MEFGVVNNRTDIYCFLCPVFQVTSTRVLVKMPVRPDLS